MYVCNVIVCNGMWWYAMVWNGMQWYGMLRNCMYLYRGKRIIIYIYIYTCQVCLQPSITKWITWQNLVLALEVRLRFLLHHRLCMAQWLEGTILGGWNLLHSHRIFLHIGYLPIIFPYIEFPYINIWYDITIYYVVSWSWISWDFMRYNGIHRSNLIIWINGISTPNVWCVSQQEWWYNETLWRYHGDIYIIIIITIYIYIYIYIYTYIYICMFG